MFLLILMHAQCSKQCTFPSGGCTTGWTSLAFRLGQELSVYILLSFLHFHTFFGGGFARKEKSVLRLKFRSLARVQTLNCIPSLAGYLSVLNGPEYSAGLLSCVPKSRKQGCVLKTNTCIRWSLFKASSAPVNEVKVNKSPLLISIFKQKHT